MSFEQFSFDARINAGIKAAGFVRPTPIQEQAIPAVLDDRDVLGLAQTGTGKTAAFMLPILQRLTRGPLRRVRALVLAPTRELAEQIHEATTVLGKKTKVRSTTIYGGVGKGGQIAALRRGAEVVVACPGRLLDLMGEGAIDLSSVEVLVLDEADRMCDMGFLPDVRRILAKLPTQRQTLFFSATMPKDTRTLADEILRDPVTVQIGMIAPAKTVSHALYPVPEQRRKELLLAMLRATATGRVIVFTRTKHRARTLAMSLEKKGYRSAALQGNMSQNKRQQAINGFRKGKFDILVATDIAARGIDVAEVTHVINYDMPDTVDAYTHRIGRTGRAKQEGEAFTIAVEKDAEMVREIERMLELDLERRRLDGFNYGDFVPEEQYRAAASKQNGNRGGSRANGSAKSGSGQPRRRRRSSSRRRVRRSQG